jgi:type IV secretory pathway component VirB8
MEKSKFISYLLAGYKSEIRIDTLRELKLKTTEFELKHKNQELSDFAKNLDTEFPEFKALNGYLIRSKLTKIESHLKTIKKIIVLIFVLSIITAIIMAIIMALGI